MPTADSQLAATMGPVSTKDYRSLDAALIIAEPVVEPTQPGSHGRAERARRRCRPIDDLKANAVACSAGVRQAARRPRQFRSDDELVRLVAADTFISSIFRHHRGTAPSTGHPGRTRRRRVLQGTAEDGDGVDDGSIRVGMKRHPHVALLPGDEPAGQRACLQAEDAVRSGFMSINR